MSDLTEFLWLIPTSRQTKVIFKLDWTIHKIKLISRKIDKRVFKELLRSMFEFEDKFTSLYLGVNYKLEGLQGHKVVLLNKFDIFLCLYQSDLKLHTKIHIFGSIYAMYASVSK